MTGRTALVTGAAGQDGSYLIERLLTEGYAVHGLVRPGAAYAVGGSPDDGRTGAGTWQRHEVDQGDLAGLGDVIDAVEPDEIYNLAGVSSVARSWAEPERTALVTGEAAVRILRSGMALQDRLGRPVRVLQASSAEMFGYTPNAWGR